MYWTTVTTRSDMDVHDCNKSPMNTLSYPIPTYCPTIIQGSLEVSRMQEILVQGGLKRICLTSKRLES